MLKVKMLPHLQHFRSEESGIKRVVQAYYQYLPQFGIELVDPDVPHHDVSVAHAGMAGHEAMVSHLHGLYWTADYHADAWEWRANASVIESIRSARQVTVPSEWVAETLRRDMHLNPHVVPHGIDYGAWNPHDENQGYVLWNKNRHADVCSPAPVGELAKRFPNTRFLTTFAPDKPTLNIKATGLVKHDAMKSMIEHAGVYLATTKETFGIGILESIAAGVPVLAFRHGGVCDIVRHGIEGYLAEPGNYDDLAEGLNYCIKHRAILGANACQRSKAFRWESVAEQVAGIYRMAAQSEKPTVGVIIPCYNYAHMLERAVNSVLDQTHAAAEIIIVDDGSTDNTEEMGRALAQRHETVQYVRQSNMGVAHARNAGIRHSHSKYIACLDADDALQPRFLEACISELEMHNSLGIAYTRLQWIKPDGSTGISQWPGEYNFNNQLNRKNQIPTACVFRRSMWESLGGYRQRYAPNGAGAEDADFWTRAGAYGWDANLATEEPLFVYSWGSGATSQSEYQEVDWLSDKPWVADGMHLFASMATPKKWSHPVRQYDAPVVSIIIPVGPGHEDYLIDALDSVENQAFRQWEAIVVWDSPNKEFLDERMAAYPFAKFIVTDGEQGAGTSRNMGAKLARSPFILFLDADDTLHMRALSSMLDAWGSTESIAYTDYYGVAHVEDVSKLSNKLQRRIVSRNERTAETTIIHEAFDYDWKRAQRQPEQGQPYIWCNVTCLIPTAWHREIGGFDESMHSWEDVDYHYRMAQRGKPYVRIPEPLMTYRFYSGNRRENGRQDHKNLVEYLNEKYKGVETMACNSCGKNRHSAPVQQMAVDMTMAAPEMTDDNFIMVRLVDGNKGDHAIVGHVTKNRYGHRSHGDTFLMDRRDVAVKPGAFQEVVQASVTVPQATHQPTPEPVAVDGAEVGLSSGIIDTGEFAEGWPGDKSLGSIVDRQNHNDESLDERIKKLSKIRVHVNESLGEKLGKINDQINESINETFNRINGIKSNFDLQLIPGVTASIAEQLAAQSVDSLESLAQWGIADLMALKGVGEARAEQIRAYVDEQLK